jgi:riboflavin kinase/FMN adenylyltransferase
LDTYSDYRQLGAPSAARRVVAMGFFDGLHAGHRSLVETAIKQARDETGPDTAWGAAGALTFWPHPLKLLHPHDAPPLLMTLEEKRLGMAGLGLDFLVVQPFTDGFSRLSPAAFLEEVLVNGMKADVVVVGFNFRFGRDGYGTSSWLSDHAGRMGIKVIVIDPVTIDGEVVSSSAVRDHVREGRVERAAVLMGRSYAMKGKVRRGEGRGRALGYPTANVTHCPDVVVPAHGVYAVVCAFRHGEKPRRMWGVANVGCRPTFNPQAEGSRSSAVLEVHLPGFAGELYGTEVEVEFKRFLRPERAFPDAQALMRQIAFDVARAAEAFREFYIPWESV